MKVKGHHAVEIVGDVHGLDLEVSHHAGVVDQDIEFAIRLDGRGKEHIDILLVCHIRLHKGRVMPSIAELLFECLALFAASTAENDLGAFLAIAPDDTLANARRRARDDCDLSIKFAHLFPPLCCELRYQNR